MNDNNNINNIKNNFKIDINTIHEISKKIVIKFSAIYNFAINNNYFNPHSAIYVQTRLKSFNIDKLLTIIEKIEDEGILDYLINLMHEKYTNQSFFYLNQICIILTYKNYIYSLERFILEKCIQNLKFSLKITLLLKSFKQSKVIDTINFQIERIMMSNNLKSQILMNKNEFLISNNSNNESEIHYYYRCLEFYDILKKLCLLLNNYPKTKEKDKLSRKEVLKEFIDLINDEIDNIKLNNYFKIKKNIEKKKELIYNKGYILPFTNKTFNDDEHSLVIVNILEEESFCFSTKERVPIKLCCECVEMSELEDFYDLYINEKFNEKKNKYINNTNKEKEENIDLSVSISLTKQLSLFNINKIRIFDKWKDLEEFKLKNNFNDNKDENLNNKNKKEFPELLEDFQEEDDFVVVSFNPENFNPFGEPFENLNKTLKSKSKFKNFKTYQIKSFIAKANDDLKQEMLILQLITKFSEILFPLNIYIKSYEIIITGEDSGLIEFLSNTCSIDGILQTLPKNWNLNKFFRNYFFKNLKEAQYNFLYSLVGFCLISYYLQIKDRHNGNILLDNKGHIMHIDFGFVLGSSPKNLNFEKANFKLTKDYIEILNGKNSDFFIEFKRKFVEGILECRKNYEILNTILRIMAQSKLKCFEGKDMQYILKEFYNKFCFNMSKKEIEVFVEKMVENCYENFFTKKYDDFQYYTNGILF